MQNNNKNGKGKTDKPLIEQKNGLTIEYDKEKLQKLYPNLITEIFEKKKYVKIDSITGEKSEKTGITNQNIINHESSELTNPKAIDFIRRCKKKEEALEILDYLLKRKEISISDYDKYKSKILKEEGLKKLINACGGPKEPGYYLKKYYEK